MSVGIPPEHHVRRRAASFRLGEKICSASRLDRFRYAVFGTKAREKEWARRHLSKGNDWNNTEYVGKDDEWVLSYWDSRNHSHRPLLIERVSSFYPFTSVLEIGCNCGPNLYLLADKFPDVEIRGVDINLQAVKRGNELLELEGMTNVRLLAGKADELGQFQDGSFDIVLTDAILIYIGPDKIGEVAREMFRIARKALILLEWHCFESAHEDPFGYGVYHHGKWMRDYVALFKQYVPKEQIHATKITHDIWPDAVWREVGAIIEVVL